MKPSKYVGQKFKTVDGLLLPAEAFAYCGDAQDPSTWKLPIVFRGDVKRTVNHIKNAISRFDAVKGIPATARQSVWLLIRGAAIAHGLQVPNKSFATDPADKAHTHVEDKARELNEQNKDEEAAIAAAIAKADALTEKMLRKLGLS